MNFKKIVTGALVGTMTMAMATTAFADDYSAFLMFADASWAWGNWNPAESGTDAAIDLTAASKEYTVSLSKAGFAETPEADASGAVVFCVDMNGLAAALGVSADDADDTVAWDSAADKQAFCESKGITISNVSVSTDGNVYKTLAAGEYVYGDIEDKGNLRIEIANEYGSIKPAGYADMKVTDTLSVTFTLNISQESADKPAEPSGDVAPIAYLAAIVAVAGIAMVASKKRA